MKILLYTVGLIVSVTICFSCSPSRFPQPVQRDLTNVYRYGFNNETDAYERPGFDNKKLGVFTTRDTASSTQQVKSTQGWVGLTFRGRLVWVNSPNIYPIDTKKTSQGTLAYSGLSPRHENRVVKHTLTNGFGLGVGGATKAALIADALYKYRRHTFRIGYTHQFNGQLGGKKGTQLANYGRTVTGQNTYFAALGAGYDFWINNKFAVGIDGYLGYHNAFSNYSDKRFSAGGYHMITGYETASGYGGKLNYLFSPYFMASAGYNTLTGANFSIYVVSFGEGD